MSKLSILIVEDEAIVAEDLAGKIRQLGYEVAGITASGEEAIELAGQHQPSLVLMDILLSGAMDGIEAATVIHGDCNLPVLLLFLTANSDMSTVKRAQQAEAFGYILKPFDERDLRIQIEMALYKHDAEQRQREAENRFRALFNNITESVFVLGIDGDQAGRFSAVNDVACERLGYSREELLTLSPVDIDDPDSGSVAGEVIKNLKLDTNVLFEQVHVTKDKRRIDMELNVRLFMYRGEPTIVCTGRDITERKLTQKKLLALNEELELLWAMPPLNSRCTFMGRSMSAAPGRKWSKFSCRWPCMPVFRPL
jgi:PAS domain S-box-containing protein